MRRFLLYDNRGQDTKSFGEVVAEGVMMGGSQDVYIYWSGENDSFVVWASDEKKTGWQKFEEVSVKGHDHEGKLGRWVKWIDT